VTQTQVFLPHSNATPPPQRSCGLLPNVFRSGSLERPREVPRFCFENCPNVATTPDTLGLLRITLHANSELFHIVNVKAYFTKK
jgi:hypothetical protein